MFIRTANLSPLLATDYSRSNRKRGRRDPHRILHLGLERIVEEERLVDKLRHPVMARHEKPLYLALFKPVGIDRRPVLLDNLDIVRERVEFFGRLSRSVSGQRDELVLSKRARGEVGDEGLDDAYAGVAGSADDEDGGGRHGREGALLLFGVYVKKKGW